MPRRPYSISGGPGAGVGTSPLSAHTPPLVVPQPLADPPRPSSLPREGMTCVAHYFLAFVDPDWGPISMQLSVWRDDQADLPDYTVVVE